MANGAAEGFGDRLFDRLPSHITAGLTVEQRSAIALAAREKSGPPPVVNMRFGVGLPGQRFFVTFMAGPERRATARRASERSANPLLTRGNGLFVFGIAVLLYAFAVMGLVIFSSVPQI